MNGFFLRRRERFFPTWLYALVTDMFAIVQHWEPRASGPARGRLFEDIFCRYCDYHQLSLSERPGARTIRHSRSASGFAHETDAFITSTSIAVHLELKYLSQPLAKNELLIFNQKGCDFLMGDGDVLHRVPLYRVMLSGAILTPAARRFALQWGILVIEPDRLPLLMLHQLAGRRIPNLRTVDIRVQDEIWTEIPAMLSPLQLRLEELPNATDNGIQAMRRMREDRILNALQREIGDQYWMAIDRSEPEWLERRYEELNRVLGLDWSASTRRSPYARGTVMSWEAAG